MTEKELNDVTEKMEQNRAQQQGDRIILAVKASRDNKEWDAPIVKGLVISLAMSVCPPDKMGEPAFINFCGLLLCALQAGVLLERENNSKPEAEKEQIITRLN